VAPPEKTEPLRVCVDADVLIAGLLSRIGASHAILVLGELGLLRLVLPESAVAEVRRNLGVKRDSFPPFSMTLDCSCPDAAELCKHVAAVLYGVSIRLDARHVGEGQQRECRRVG
jgi:hypothetical protein